MDCPLANAFHFGELGEERRFVHGGDGGVRKLPGRESGREIVEVGGLAAGDADGAQVGGGERKDRGRGYRVGGCGGRRREECEEASIDGVGGGGRELLVEDGACEGVECREGWGSGEGGGLSGGDDRGEERVRSLEVA